MTTSPTFRLRAAAMIEQLHALGARPLLELISELAEGREELTLGRMRTYAGLDPRVLDALDGRDIQPAPLHLLTGTGTDG